MNPLHSKIFILMGPIIFPCTPKYSGPIGVKIMTYTNYVKFDVFTDVTMQNTSLWNVTRGSSVEINRLFEKDSAFIIRSEE
jgi:hypothetical protein